MAKKGVANFSNQVAKQLIKEQKKKILPPNRIKTIPPESHLRTVIHFILCQLREIVLISNGIKS